jgi:hypothetical protein
LSGPGRCFTDRSQEMLDGRLISPRVFEPATADEGLLSTACVFTLVLGRRNGFGHNWEADDLHEGHVGISGHLLRIGGRPSRRRPRPRPPTLASRPVACFGFGARSLLPLAKAAASVLNQAQPGNRD